MLTELLIQQETGEIFFENMNELLDNKWSMCKFVQNDI